MNCQFVTLYISSKDDTDTAEVGEVKSETTSDDPTRKEETKDDVLIAKEDSIVKEKGASKEKSLPPSLSRGQSMEENLLCGICQVSNLHVISLPLQYTNAFTN